MKIFSIRARERVFLEDLLDFRKDFIDFLKDLIDFLKDLADFLKDLADFLQLASLSSSQTVSQQAHPWLTGCLAAWLAGWPEKVWP